MTCYYLSCDASEIQGHSFSLSVFITFEKNNFITLAIIFSETPDLHMRMDVNSMNQMKLISDYEGYMVFAVLPGHEAHRNNIIDASTAPGWHSKCPIYCWENKREEIEHFAKFVLRGDNPNNVVHTYGNIMYHKRKSLINFIFGATSSINGSKLIIFYRELTVRNNFVKTIVYV